MSGLFITGTDTGVGKTAVACGVAALIRSWKHNIGIMKPVATGDREDVIRLARSAGISDPPVMMNPQFFKAPLAPRVAARLESKEVDMEAIYQAYWYLKKQYDFLVVEGAGGVMVPLADSTYMLDLMQALQLPVLVVARAGLGTLNHSLLTIEALVNRKINVIGILLNGATGKDKAEKHNLDELQDHTTLPVFGMLKHDPALSRQPAHLSSALEKMPRLVQALRSLLKTIPKPNA